MMWFLRFRRRRRLLNNFYSVFLYRRERRRNGIKFLFPHFHCFVFACCKERTCIIRESKGRDGITVAEELLFNGSVRQVPDSQPCSGIGSHHPFTVVRETGIARCACFEMLVG